MFEESKIIHRPPVDVMATEIANWIADYATAAGVKALVVGVSGGIDSSVVAHLCAEAAVRAKLNLVMVSIPMSLSDLESGTVRDVGAISNSKDLGVLQAIAIINKYGIQERQTVTGSTHSFRLEEAASAISTDFTSGGRVTVMQVNMQTSLSEFKKSFWPLENINGNSDGLAMANTASRLRMIALYYVATQHAGIVVGTGNKVEDFGVGFFTKHGDGGVDISPIADLYKSHVYDLGRHFDVLPEIMGAAPTDGLWADNRNDETQLGATYAALEWAMEYDALPSHPKGREEHELDPEERKALAVLRARRRTNYHKMAMPPKWEMQKPVPKFQRR